MREDFLQIIEKKLIDEKIEIRRRKEIFELIKEYQNNNGSIKSINYVICLIYLGMNKVLPNDSNQYYEINKIEKWFDKKEVKKTNYPTVLKNIKEKITKFDLISPCSWDDESEVKKVNENIENVSNKTKKKDFEKYYTNISYRKFYNSKIFFERKYPEIKQKLKKKSIIISFESEEIIKERFFTVLNTKIKFQAEMLLKVIIYYVITRIQSNSSLRYEYLVKDNELNKFKRYLFKYIPMIKERYNDNDSTYYINRFDMILSKFKRLPNYNRKKITELYDKCSKELSCNSLPLMGAIIDIAMSNDLEKTNKMTSEIIGIEHQRIVRAKKLIRNKVFNDKENERNER